MCNYCNRWNDCPLEVAISYFQMWLNFQLLNQGLSNCSCPIPSTTAVQIWPYLPMVTNVLLITLLMLQHMII
jgi:hypothetical protein